MKNCSDNRERQLRRRHVASPTTSGKSARCASCGGRSLGSDSAAQRCASQRIVCCREPSFPANSPELRWAVVTARCPDLGRVGPNNRQDSKCARAGRSYRLFEMSHSLFAVINVAFRSPGERSGAKKNRRAGYPKGFQHVGLLFNEPPGSAGLLFIQSSDGR